MKTQLNNTLNRYLLIGLTISQFITIESCKKVEYVKHGEFHFINNSSHHIIYQSYLEKYNLKPGSSVIIKITQNGAEKKPTDNDYDPPFIKEIGFKIPLTIYFDDKKCWKVNLDTEHSPINIKSYTKHGKIGYRTYKFTYTFTEEDYSRTTDCP